MQKIHMRATPQIEGLSGLDFTEGLKRRGYLAHNIKHQRDRFRRSAGFTCCEKHNHYYV